MTEIEREGNLDKWIATNIRWLVAEKETLIKDECEQHDQHIAELEKEIDRLKAQLAEVEKAKKDELARLMNLTV